MLLGAGVGFSQHERFMTADGKPYNGDITTLPVRGQDFDGFTKSVRDPKFDPDATKQALGKRTSAQSPNPTCAALIGARTGSMPWTNF